MKILIASGAPADVSGYLAEILTAFGLCFHQIVSVSSALQAASAECDCIVLPAGCPVSAAEAVDLRRFLHAGGSVIAVMPESPVEALAGLSRIEELSTPARLRLLQAVCFGSRGETLTTAGPWRIYKEQYTQDAMGSGGLEPIAQLFEHGTLSHDSVGIVERSISDGRLIVYAYDPAHCIRRLRQGYPERANFLPADEVTPRSAWLHPFESGADTFWRPTADLHALTFCEIVRRELERNRPVPGLWHLPGTSAAILLFSGDEDAAPQEANEAQMQDIEQYGAAMNLYVFAGNTSIDRDRIDDFTRRGHTVSVHPFLSDTAGQEQAVQVAKAESEVLLFRERFGRPVRTVRNHSYMWPGYLEIPELWEKLGIGMDANTTSTLRGESFDWGPFVKLNAAMPLRFVREDGRLIDVFQQPTHLNDDQMLQPVKVGAHKYRLSEAKTLMERVLHDAVYIDHSPICANFHPENYVKFSGDAGRALLCLANSFGVPVWSIERWHNFWRARSAWQILGVNWADSILTFEVHGEECEQLTLSVPAEFNGKQVQQMSIDGEKAVFAVHSRRGRQLAQVTLPAGTRRALIEVHYQTVAGESGTSGGLNNA